jgi:hypothetical protein
MSSVVACKKIFNEQQHPLTCTPINTCNENKGGMIYPVVKTILKKIPIKVIITDNQQDITTTTIPSPTTEDNNYIQILKTTPMFSQEQSLYPFSILKSRKKEKKYLRKKFNTIMSRVHNMDCLLKKIKAKFLKYVFIKVKKAFAYMNINIKKFDQSKEVRNLNVKHNRDNFINLKIVDVLINNNLITKEDSITMLEHANHEVISILNMKIKYFYQFDFLKSNYFKSWLKDPIKLKNIALNNNNSSSITMVKNCINNSKTISKHSKTIFKAHPEDYEKYKRLLLHTSCNFIFYFQNNPLKFGKKII